MQKFITDECGQNQNANLYHPPENMYLFTNYYCFQNKCDLEFCKFTSPKIKYDKGIKYATENEYWFGVDKIVYNMQGKRIGQFKEDLCFYSHNDSFPDFSKWSNAVKCENSSDNYSQYHKKLIAL